MFNNSHERFVECVWSDTRRDDYQDDGLRREHYITAAVLVTAQPYAPL